MKIYADTHNKDVKAHVLYIDTNYILYFDPEFQVGVTADEILGLIATGVLVYTDNEYLVPTGLTLPEGSTLYATVTLGEGTVTTIEAAEDAEVGRSQH